MYLSPATVTSGRDGLQATQHVRRRTYIVKKWKATAETTLRQVILPSGLTNPRPSAFARFVRSSIMARHGAVGAACAIRRVRPAHPEQPNNTNSQQVGGSAWSEIGRA